MNIYISEGNMRKLLYILILFTGFALLGKNIDYSKYANNIGKVYSEKDNCLSMAVNCQYICAIEKAKNNRLELIIYNIKENSLKKEASFYVGKESSILGEQPISIYRNDILIGILNKKDLSGRVFFISKIKGKWQETASFKGSREFGATVSLKKNKAIVSSLNPGNKVYLFEKMNGHWNKSTTLNSIDSNQNVFSGDSAICGNFAFVPGENKIIRTGKSYYTNHNIYVFEKIGNNNWLRVGFLKNPDPLKYTYNNKISASDDFLAVIAKDNDRNKNVVMIYKKEIRDWKLVEVIDNSDINFGYSVSICNNKLIVGSVNTDANTGKLYIYNLQRKNWNLVGTFEGKFDKKIINKDYSCRKIII